MEHYFAYGSNLKYKQLISRCPSTIVLNKAILYGYKLTFPRKSKMWYNAGVAGIIKDSLAQTHGVIYQISKKDLLKLDEIEGCDIYPRKKVSLNLCNNTVLKCWTYIAVTDEGFPFTPSTEYINTIIQGAIEHELCEKYVEQLKKWKKC